MRNNLFVFDSNTLLSALFNDESIPARALIKARSTGILLVSDETAAEYIDVFSRSKFDKYLPLAFRFAFIENIIANALPVVIETMIKECRDPKDDKFLSLAVSGKADCIITGDTDLLILNPFRNIPIVNPAYFLSSF